MVEEAIKGQIAVVMQYGLLGSLFIISLAAIWMLAKGRLADWKEIGGIVLNNATAMAANTASSDARTRSLEASVRSQELATAAQLALSTNIDDLREEVVGMRGDLQKMRDTMNQRGLPV